MANLSAEKRLGESVRWTRRSTPLEEYFSTHYDGDYKVEVCEQDGDYSYWHVWRMDKLQAKGEVYAPGDDEAVAKDLAISALRAIQAEYSRS